MTTLSKVSKTFYLGDQCSGNHKNMKALSKYKKNGHFLHQNCMLFLNMVKKI